MKILAMLVGAVILFTTAHVSILATGGYGSSHAYIALGVAAGVAVASIAVGRAWGERRRALAMFLVVAIAAGEVFALLSTAERLTAAREASQAPLRQAVEARHRLEARVSKAEAAVTALPDASARLQAAMQSKAAADTAVVTKSAERTCAANCRLLLQAQADQSHQEVEAARRDMTEARSRLEQAVTDARADLAGFKAPPSASPLADRIGWPAWVLDLVMAGLGSIAANGLACALMVFGAHRKTAPAVSPGRSQPETPELPAPETASELPRTVGGTKAGNVVPIRAAARSGARGPSQDAIKQAKGFMVARITRTDDDAETDVRALYRDYVSWQEGKGRHPLPETDIGAALVHLFKLAQIPFGPKDGKAIARGLPSKPEADGNLRRGPVCGKLSGEFPGNSLGKYLEVFQPSTAQVMMVLVQMYVRSRGSFSAKVVMVRAHASPTSHMRSNSIGRSKTQAAMPGSCCSSWSSDVRSTARSYSTLQLTSNRRTGAKLFVCQRRLPL